MKVEIKLSKGQRRWMEGDRKRDNVGHRGICSYIRRKKGKFLLYFIFYEIIYNPHSNSKSAVIICPPPGFSQNRFVNQIRFKGPPSAHVRWERCLPGCSSWVFSTMWFGDDSEQNSMVGPLWAPSDNYYNHAVVFLQADVFFYNTSRKLFTSGMMNDSQAQFRQILRRQFMADT